MICVTQGIPFSLEEICQDHGEYVLLCRSKARHYKVTKKSCPKCKKHIFATTHLATLNEKGSDVFESSLGEILFWNSDGSRHLHFNGRPK